MKKLITKVLCGVLVSSVMLCGCNQVSETAAPSETESQTEVTTTETETETTPAPVETPARPEINVDNMMKVADLYASKKAEGKDFPQIFVDGIRGQGSYYIDDGDFNFFYSAINGLSSIQIRLTSGNRTAGVVYELNYKGKRIYGRQMSELMNLRSSLMILSTILLQMLTFMMILPVPIIPRILKKICRSYIQDS